MVLQLVIKLSMELMKVLLIRLMVVRQEPSCFQSLIQYSVSDLSSYLKYSEKVAAGVTWPLLHHQETSALCLNC